MNKRKLGTNGLEVCMSMTGGYSDKPDRQEMISLLHTAVDRGVTFFDTAEIYVPVRGMPLSRLYPEFER